MLEARRSTGNARETMKLPGIKRSTLFRTRDTCSGSRHLDSRTTDDDTKNKRQNKGAVAVVNYRGKVKSDYCESRQRARNITGGYRSPELGKFTTEIRENSAEPTTADFEKWQKHSEKVLESSESKIHLKSEQVLEDLESFRCCWEWKVDEVAGPARKSDAMTKLRSLRQERKNVFADLTTSLRKMLDAVRHMKNEQSRLR